MKGIIVSGLLAFLATSASVVGIPTPNVKCCRNSPQQYPAPPAYSPPPAPQYSSPPAGYNKQVVYTAPAPTMTTYTIHTYHSPAPTPKPSANSYSPSSSYVPAHGSSPPAPAPYAAPVPCSNGAYKK